MGIIRQGIFGGFEGKTGPLVGRKVNGKSVISALPHKTTKPGTRAQLDQQLKFELLVSVLKCFKCLTAIGFKDAAGKKNSFNAALKYNFKHIIIGTSPDYGIDYSKLTFSKGNLAGPNNPAISLAAHAVHMSWQPDVQTQFNRYTDEACFAVYNPVKATVIIAIRAAERSDLGYTLLLPSGFADEELHCYMSFVAGKQVSDSIYVGEFTVV